MSINPLTIIGPFKQLLTMSDVPLKGPLREDAMQVIDDGGILIRGEVIERVGKFKELKQGGIPIVHLEGDCVGMPGLIDAHTHICFGGNRSKDYAMRISGKSYQEIAASGGGIWESVKKTREASEGELIQGIVKRAKRHLSEGVTTCEVKSGYGLNIESELKMLRAIRSANETVSLDLITTCLAAHIKPKDFEGDEENYLTYILNEILPSIRKNNLSNRVDIFIEQNAFSIEPAKRFLHSAKQSGFDLTVHADQFTPGGSRVAVEVGAVSADHLEASTSKEIEMLAKSDVIAVALPGASLGLGCPFTPARKLLDHGASLVIASDWNPGSAPMGDLLMQASVISAFEKLNIAETFAAITSRAAAALRLNDCGILAVGNLADIITFPTQDYRDILYHQGKLKPARIWKRGAEVTLKKKQTLRLS